jgi:hypothetical protein
MARGWRHPKDLGLATAPRRPEACRANQDRHDYEYAAEPAATVIAGPVQRTAPETAKASEQHDYQNNEQDGSYPRKTQEMVFETHNRAFALLKGATLTTGSIPSISDSN